MNPLITKVNTSKGEVSIEIRQFKTIYTLDGVKYEGLTRLLNQFEAIDSVALHILTHERAIILRHYAHAMKDKTALQLMEELSDMGVTTKSIEFICQGDGCEETAVEEVDAPLRVDDVASQAEYACEFTDGLCQSCDMQKQQEDAMEEVSRARHEAREDRCNA